MPGFSDSMTQATIVRWLKEDGEHVERGDELLEIETDKATMSYEAEATGLLQIVALEGTTVSVGAVIGQIGEGSIGAPAVAPVDPSPPAEAATVPAVDDRGSVRATPLARLLARTHGIDLTSVAGTGPRGRVTRSDVALSAGIAAAEPRSASPLVTARDGNRQSPGSVTVHELTNIQRTIARRMAEAKATIPEFQVQTEVAMDAALTLRAKLRPLVGEGELPSLNDLVVKAVALALREHPRVNGAYMDGRFELYSDINVGIAVAADDALVVPVVTHADKRPLVEIAAETRRLAEFVRSGRLTPADVAGGTFTVSNLGMFGMTAITPVVNPPQAAILGVGATRELPHLSDGELTTVHLATLTLTCDHRILYGADAARFLSAVRDLLQEPLRLML